MLLLEAAAEPPAGALAEVLAVGLSCDAYHPAAPHPDGAGRSARHARRPFLRQDCKPQKLII